MSKINPGNKCVNLYKQISKKNPLKEMFRMQEKLQRYMASRGKALDIDKATFGEKVDDISVQFRNITMEFAELLERLPFKEWKEYNNEERDGWASDEQKMECYYEYEDMFAFFLNIGLLMGINDTELTNLFFTKNEEVFKRIENNY